MGKKAEKTVHEKLINQNTLVEMTKERCQVLASYVSDPIILLF